MYGQSLTELIGDLMVSLHLGSKRYELVLILLRVRVSRYGFNVTRNISRTNHCCDINGAPPIILASDDWRWRTVNFIC